MRNFIYVDVNRYFVLFFFLRVQFLLPYKGMGRASELCTGLSKKMDGILNCYNLKSTGRIYAFGVLKCSEEFKVLDLP